MTTSNESSRVEPATEILSPSVREKLEAIHQTNNSKDSSSSRLLSIPCIYKVSKELRELNKSAYNPSVVSIGPIHNNNDDDDDKEEQHLKAMEHIKVAYTKELLCRIATKSASPEKKQKELVSECSTVMLHLQDKALNCYAENLKLIIEKKIRQHSLAQMLLIDGCFILELLYRFYLEETVDLNTQGDPLLSNSLIMLGIRHDLLLLENQLPFFILKELFNKTIKMIPNHPRLSCPSLTQLVLKFFGNMMNFENYIQSTTINPENDNCFHILHLIHSCYLPSPHNHAGELRHFSHRALDLKRAGVKFVEGKGKDQFDVDFEEAPGLLRWCRSAKFVIPPLIIYEGTEPLLRNLIAFEQCCPYPYIERRIKRRHITSYAFLMDSLIDSAADVKLLENKGIIKNYLGCSEEASVLFNNICKHVELEQFDFAIPRHKAECHCNSWWPRRLALLKRDYFSNPWSFIAFLAASILFALAVVQTVYALLAYYGEYGTVRELYDMHSVL